MNAPWDLSLTASQHGVLLAHLFPGDGFEAAAILFCRPATPARRKLMVVDFWPVPHALCSIRTAVRLSWPGQILADAGEVAEADGLSVILVHSHPGGFRDFSQIDDDSDLVAVGSLHANTSGREVDAGHGSAIMLPDGSLRARLYRSDMVAEPIARTFVIGDEIVVHRDERSGAPSPMAFGTEMTEALGQLHICVVGVSGTGSVIAEQAARMGAGSITLIDFDRVESKNLNRILNSTAQDADNQALKVEMFAHAIRRVRPHAKVAALPISLLSATGVAAAASADVIFCCVDSVEGRQVADVIAQAFMVPLIDMGVTIPTRTEASGRLAVAEVSGRIDYVKPGGATLFDRGVYSAAALRREYLARAAPEAFEEQQREGYIKGAPAEAPSVIALNMRAASAAMMELVSRLCPFRHDGNAAYARTIFALADGDEDRFAEASFDCTRLVGVGAGASEPLLAPYFAPEPTCV